MLVKNLDILWPYSFFLLLKKGDVPPAPLASFGKMGRQGAFSLHCSLIFLVSFTTPHQAIVRWCCAMLSCSSVCGDSPGKNTGEGRHALLHWIFPTQGSNPGLLHCRQILYQLSYQGSPIEMINWPILLLSLEERIYQPQAIRVMLLM